MKWGQQKAAEHMKEFPTHAAIGGNDLWCCADCDALIPIMELTERSFKFVKAAIKDAQKSIGGANE